MAKRIFALLIFAAMMTLCQTRPHGRVRTAISSRGAMPSRNLIFLADFSEESGQVIHDWSNLHQDGKLGSTTGVDNYDPLWTRNGGIWINGYGAIAPYHYFAVGPNLNAYTASSALSVIAEYCINDLTNPAVLIGAYNPSSPYQGWGFGVGLGSLTGKVTYFSGTKGSWVAGATTLTLNACYQSAVTVSGTTVSFYLNGAADGTAASNVPNSYSYSFTIGGTPNPTTTNFLSGTIGLLAIYNRALSAQEIANVYRYRSGVMTARSLTYNGPTNVPFPPSFSAIPDNGKLGAPIRGYQSWAWDAYRGTRTQETTLKAEVSGLISQGLAALGYTYIIFDLPGRSRGTNGSILYTSGTFGDTQASWCSYLHGLTPPMKCGLYSSTGKELCENHGLGSYGFEWELASQLSGIGADLIEIDWCDTTYNSQVATYGSPDAEHAVFQFFGNALAYWGNPAIFLACTGNSSQAATSWVWAASAGANMWRVNEDNNTAWWTSLDKLFDAFNTAAPYTSLGHYSSGDEIPFQTGGISDTQVRTMTTLFVMAPSPILLSGDVPNINATNKATFSNSEMLAIHDDLGGHGGVRISQTACGSKYCEVWARQLTGTRTCAVAVFNRDGSATHDITVTISALETQCGTDASGYSVRDIWGAANLGTQTTSFTVTAVPAYGSGLYKLIGQ